MWGGGGGRGMQWVRISFASQRVLFTYLLSKCFRKERVGYLNRNDEQRAELNAKYANKIDRAALNLKLEKVYENRRQYGFKKQFCAACDKLIILIM